MTNSNEPTHSSSRARALVKPSALVLAGLLAAGLTGAYMASEGPAPAALAETTAQTVMTPYGAAPLSFAELAAKVRPAVVSVHVRNGGGQKMGQNFEFRGMPDLPDDHPLNEFFKRFRKGSPEGPRGGGGGSVRPSLAQGSGFIISSDGYAVTNHHVIDEASEINVTLDDGTKYKATMVGSDPRTDIALIKIEGKSAFPFVKFAQSPARVGDWVLAVGNPFGLGGTVTAGIISAHNRDIGSSPYDFLQIDAAVNRGNSGGPTFNLQGEVIGVNTAIVSPTGGNVGIAFAIPATLTEEVIAQLKSSGSVARGWLGVTIQNVSDDIAASVGLDEPKGAMITTFSENAPASGSGVAVGDVILKIDGEEIEDSRDLARTIAGKAPDAKVKVTVLRDGTTKDYTVSLGRFPGAKQLAAIQSGKPVGEELEDLGLSLAPAASYEGAGKEGVVITSIKSNSKAAEKGLKTGDVIVAVAGTPVSKPQDVITSVRKAKDKGRKAVLLQVRSGEQNRFVAIPLNKA